MDKLIRLAWISACLLAFAVPVWAAQVTIVYDEPTAGANDCASIRVYYCFGTGCTPRSLAAEFAASDANCGAVDRNLVFSLKVPQNAAQGGEACFRVTVINTAGNETDGVTSCVAVTSQ